MEQARKAFAAGALAADQTFSKSDGHGMGARRSLELAHDILNVKFDRTLTDVEDHRDFPVCLARHGPAQYLDFTLRQQRMLGGSRCGWHGFAHRLMEIRREIPQNRMVPPAICHRRFNRMRSKRSRQRSR